MNRIQFWVDQGSLIVADVKTKQTVTVTKRRNIEQFLFLYGMQLDDVQGVVEAQDTMSVFNNKN